jgi:hypothetical protein
VARISCEPCEIVFPICDCCHELLCVCSKNKVEKCDDPCFPSTEAHFPGGAPLPFFIEGMVPDVNDLGFDTNAVVGPPVSSVTISGWDTTRNFFNYQFLTDASTYLSTPGSYTNDLSDCQRSKNKFVNNSFFRNNENLKPQINIVVNELLNKSATNFTGYIPCGVAGGPVLPQGTHPYNEINYFLFRSVGLVRNSVRDAVINELDLLKHKTVTSYNFSPKYIKAMAKSILFGYFNTYFQTGKLNLIKQFSENIYRNKAVPSLITASSMLIGAQVETASSINLENAKIYIGENRIRFNTTHAGQRLTNNVLRQYWKFIPSDIDLRIRVYRNRKGESLFNASGIPIAGSSLPFEAGAWAIKVNDDDTITTHRKDGTKARVNYINAEHLRIFNNSGAHVYLDEIPRYQTGCGCCTSGCFVSLCSDRGRSYLFDAMDRSVLLGLLGAVSGFTTRSFDTDPYIKMSVSAPFTSELEFKAGIDTEGSALKDFYMLTPHLSGTDVLSGVVDPSNPHVKTTSLEYKIIATSYGLNTQRAIDRAVRFKAGPGNVFYISNEDPIFYYLNYIDKNDLTVSAEIPDLNIDGILGNVERYPRRIPCHIMIVPTDQPLQNPLFGKSLITKMEDLSESNGTIRSLKMLPAPTKTVLDSTYLDLVDAKEASLQYGTLPYGYTESDKFPFGPQGTTTNPFKMQFSASNVYASFGNWRAGVEASRRIDPVRKVFDFLTNVSSYYDTRTDITYSYGIYSRGIVGDSQYPVNNNRSLPLFDVWRHLSEFEFHEFVSSFRDTLFQKLMGNKYRGLQLYFMLNKFQEKTYLHKYDPATPTWVADGNFSGTINNPRNASGVDFIEDSLFMERAKAKDC